MPGVSDIELMELADGTLSEARRAAVEQALAASPEMQERLQAFLVTGRALSRLFDPVAGAPIPEQLRQVVLYGAPSDALHLLPKRRASAGGSLRDWLASWSDGLKWRLPPAAVMASLACAVGLGAALYWIQRPETFVGPAPHPLAWALETTPSDRVAKLALDTHGSAELRPELSFQRRDGRFCRQYYLTLDSGQAFSGYACRIQPGQWQVEMDAPTQLIKSGGPGEVRPASPVTVKAIEDAVHAAMAGDAIQIEREQRLILNHWRPRE
jgi:hypothetical protein